MAARAALVQVGPQPRCDCGPQVIGGLQIIHRLVLYHRLRSQRRRDAQGGSHGRSLPRAVGFRLSGRTAAWRSASVVEAFRRARTRTGAIDLTDRGRE
jgi:hypothetical protein